MNILLALLLSASMQAQPCQQAIAEDDEWAQEFVFQPIVRGGEMTYKVEGIHVKKCKPKGDVNGDGVVDVNDVEYLVEYLFASGPPPVCSADVNGDGVVDVEDAFYLIHYLFSGGPKPK